jgi:hypothetical protein
MFKIKLKRMCRISRKPSTVTNKGKWEKLNAKIRITPTRTSIMGTSSTYVFSHINNTQIYVHRERQGQKEYRLTVKYTYCTGVCLN